MITLDVQPYCHECDGFDPEVVTSYLSLSDIPATKSVRCTNHRKCAAIARYLEKKKAGETDGTQC